MTSEGKSLLFGLIGDPVAHSLSPFIMNRAFASLGLDAIYVAFGVRADRLAVSFSGLNALGLGGLNVTYPYKEEILYHVDAISPEAEIINAANTIARFDDELHAFNTDAAGTATALEMFTGVPLEGADAFIYGVGGSARAAAYGLLERGAERITFGVRSAEKGAMAVERLQYAFPEQPVEFVVLGSAPDLEARHEAFCSAGIVINATPVGMQGQATTALIEDASWISRGQVFFDFVYHPRRTLFLDTARRAGATTLGGLALLVSQASESFRIWTDQSFDVKEMAEAVEEFSQSEPHDGRQVH
ncbi:MAG TPA: shikimate dehydrogenase [Candidatus Krumholzibacteria bacterium]|nr:shikimate dehydrogenase [Candidatus Krumholzibacteria bacterium]